SLRLQRAWPAWAETISTPTTSVAKRSWEKRPRISSIVGKVIPSFGGVFSSIPDHGPFCNRLGWRDLGGRTRGRTAGRLPWPPAGRADGWSFPLPSRPGGGGRRRMPDHLRLQNRGSRG